MGETNSNAEQNQDRIGTLTSVVQQIASGDFAVRAPVTAGSDDIDALSMGVNMLAEELAKREAEAKDRLEQVEQMNGLFTDRELRMVALKEEIATLKKEIEELKGKASH